MKVTTQTEHDVDPRELARALSKSTAVEFGEFWLQFEKSCSDSDLDSFARRMADDSGANRKKPLIRLYELMKYHEENNRILERQRPKS